MFQILQLPTETASHSWYVVLGKVDTFENWLMTALGGVGMVGGVVGCWLMREDDGYE